MCCDSYSRNKLKFDAVYYESIRTGMKVQTTRDHLPKGMRVGSNFLAQFVLDGKGYTFHEYMLPLDIIKITQKQFKDITNHDAVEDGFIGDDYKYTTSRSAKDVMKENLLAYYPDLKPESIVYLIEFKCSNPV
jgi:hypothetical protein